jgi:hypothetical protein
LTDDPPFSGFIISSHKNTQVKIWVLPLGAPDFAVFINAFDAILTEALVRDETQEPGGPATRALKQVISFLYHNVDLIHGPPRHRLMLTVLKKGFLRLFLNKSIEVMYGFHLLVVYKLLRFHRHHAGSASDMDLLTSVGSRVLRMDQGSILNTMQAVAAKKTAAADPWKDVNGRQVEVEELDIDRALQSQAGVCLDLVRNAPSQHAKKQQEEQAEKGKTAAAHSAFGHLKNSQKEQQQQPEFAVVEDLLLLDELVPESGGGGDGGGEASAAAAAAARKEDEERAAAAAAEAEAAKAEAKARAISEEANRGTTIPPAALALVGPAIANYSKHLWEYYVSGLTKKHDIALSVFAPPLNFAKAHAAFAEVGASGPRVAGLFAWFEASSNPMYPPPPPPLAPPPRPYPYPPPTAAGGDTGDGGGGSGVVEADNTFNNGLGKRVQDRPYSDHE